MTTKPSPLPSFGTVPVKYDGAWFSAFTAQLSRRLGLLSGPYTVQPQLLLQSPNGTVYQVTVSNAGVLTTAVAATDVPSPI